MSYINIVNSTKSLVYISLACTLIFILVSKTKFQNSVKYICGITVLLSLVNVLSPLMRSLGTLADIDFSIDKSDEDKNNTSEEIIINQSASYICQYVKTLLCQRFSVLPENVSVAVTLDSTDTENIIIKNITLSLKNTDESLYPQISQFVSDTVMCECLIISK